MTPKNRIRELDAARGICILAMIAVHFVYDLTELYRIVNWKYPPVFLLLKNWGGIAFFLISGICITLGHHYLKRGLTVLGCAAAVSAVTVLSGAMPIRFGVLHCLGSCMLSWRFFRHAPADKLWAASVILILLGFCFSRASVDAPWLYPLGLAAPGFQSADYFPLLPYLGYFLAGAALGKRFYADRVSRFPKLPSFPFLCLCGRHSLFLYLIHQPVLIALIETAIFTGGKIHETIP